MIYTANLHGVAEASAMKSALLTMRLDARAAPLEATVAGVEKDFAQFAVDYASFEKGAAGYAATQTDDPQARTMVAGARPRWPSTSRRSRR